MQTMHLLPSVAIQPNLELKTRSKQLLGSLPLVIALPDICLLYTSDAADDLLCVDLGGRRIIKKIVSNSLNTNIYSYFETSGGQSYNLN